MLGKTVLYLPGFDHAGIATQSVVEKRLAKDRGLTRHNLGREKFVNLVWEWKEKYHATIKSQLKRLGGSLDWSREAFTLNSNLTLAVEETFIRLHDEGLIYRSNRLVHWCCQLNTALSNEEVDHEEIHGKTWIKVPGYAKPIAFGQLTSFAYEIPSTGERIVIATTRPETMLGDTGIAVHPDDPRYKHLIGKVAKHPFIEGLELPIVADAILVDMEFGTGAVKLTPAHDENDYEAGLRHNLKFINILNEDGTLNENAGPWKVPSLPPKNARDLTNRDKSGLMPDFLWWRL
jgi:valyl-tRNA synthetase